MDNNISKAGQIGGVRSGANDLQSVRTLLTVIQTLIGDGSPSSGEIIRQILTGITPDGRNLKRIKNELQELANGLRNGTINADQASACLQGLLEGMSGSSSPATAQTNPLDSLGSRGTIV